MIRQIKTTETFICVFKFETEKMISKSLILLLALSACSGYRTARETSAVDMFKEDITKAAERVKEVGEHISKMLGLDTNPLSQDVVHIIKNQTKTFADQAEQVQKQLEEELKQFSDSPVAASFTELSKKIGETVSSFRQQLESSGVVEKAAELQGKFQDGINNLLEESKKVAQNLEPQATEAGKELEKLTKKVLDDAVENLSQLQDKIHTATGHQHS